MIFVFPVLLAKFTTRASVYQVARVAHFLFNGKTKLRNVCSRAQLVSMVIQIAVSRVILHALPVLESSRIALPAQRDMCSLWSLAKDSVKQRVRTDIGQTREMYVNHVMTKDAELVTRGESTARNVKADYYFSLVAVSQHVLKAFIKTAALALTVVKTVTMEIH